MAMTREEERELRMNCSIGKLLGNLSTRDDLKKPLPEETTEEEGEGESGVKRSAEEQGGTAKKPKDAEEKRALEFFQEETPDFEEDDPDWVKEEKKYLIEEYGKKIITLSFDERDRFVYTCEVCNVESPQRKILEAHCMGMKHLRKKALLDRRLQGKDVPSTFKVTKSTSEKVTKPSGTTKPRDPEEKKKWSDKELEDKKKWHYYNYGGGNPHQFYNQPPPGFPGPPPPGPPPNYYGQWGPPPPNIFNTPPPALEGGKSTGKDSLAGGDTGSLLQKLADCAVKNEKDSELAINVVIALMKSLKDFNHKRGETKYIEVLTEADVTFRVLKTLKPSNKDIEKEPSPTPAPTETSQDSSATGVSDFAQGTPPVSQSSGGNYDNQYYNSNSNSSYSYGSGQDYPNPVPPPANFNPRGTNGYNQDGSQNYGPNPAYSNQGPANSQANSTSYPSQQNYSNQGFGNQGAGYYNQGQGGNNQNSDGYSYSSGSYPQQPGGPPNSQGAGSGPKGDSSSIGPVPPPPPPTSGDGSSPDFSNYGYAAGYSMGYYNVPPPAYSL